MDFNSAFTGAGMCIGLLLSYLALTREAKAQFWPILMGVFQICLMAYAVFWIADFAMKAGSPSRLEVFNFAVWTFNFLMTANSLVTRIAAAYHTRSANR